MNNEERIKELQDELCARECAQVRQETLDQLADLTSRHRVDVGYQSRNIGDAITLVAAAVVDLWEVHYDNPNSVPEV